MTFDEWFQGSLVVSDGAPQVCYHGSSAWNSVSIEEFRPLSHFGTVEAANARLDHLRKLPMHPDVEAIYPVYLSIKHPLTINDAVGVQHSNLVLARQMAFGSSHANYADLNARNWRSGAITLDEYYDIVHAREKQAERIVEVMQVHGFDGFRYTNQVEHRRSTSWIILSPSQARSVLEFKGFPQRGPNGY